MFSFFRKTPKDTKRYIIRVFDGKDAIGYYAGMARKAYPEKDRAMIEDDINIARVLSADDAKIMIEILRDIPLKYYQREWTFVAEPIDK